MILINSVLLLLIAFLSLELPLKPQSGWCELHWNETIFYSLYIVSIYHLTNEGVSWAWTGQQGGNVHIHECYHHPRVHSLTNTKFCIWHWHFLSHARTGVTSVYTMRNCLVREESEATAAADVRWMLTRLMNMQSGWGRNTTQQQWPFQNKSG